MTAVVSLLAVASNVFLMTETLPRIVEARRAKQLEDEGDLAAPLLTQSPSSQADDIEGVSGRLANMLTRHACHRTEESHLGFSSLSEEWPLAFTCYQTALHLQPRAPSNVLDLRWYAVDSCSSALHFLCRSSRFPSCVILSASNVPDAGGASQGTPVTPGGRPVNIAGQSASNGAAPLRQSPSERRPRSLRSRNSMMSRSPDDVRMLQSTFYLPCSACLRQLSVPPANGNTGSC